jgi:hypothetical protein
LAARFRAALMASVKPGVFVVMTGWLRMNGRDETSSPSTLDPSVPP